MSNIKQMELTEKQWQIYVCIRDYYLEYGYPPTVREIGRRVGLSSTASVHGQLKNLEKKGVIERKEDCPRTISLKKQESDKRKRRVCADEL